MARARPKALDAAAAAAAASARRPRKVKPFATDWRAQAPDATLPRVAFLVTTAESVPQIKIWMQYHRAVGVSVFYLFVEGQAGRPEAMAELRRQPGVTVIPRDAELKARHAASRIWNETWLSAFFHKPCNHELFVTQSLNMERE